MGILSATLGQKLLTLLPLPRQLKLSMAMAKGDWRGSDASVKAGGVSVSDFVKAVKTSEASSTLNKYTAKEVTKDIKRRQDDSTPTC